MPYKRNKPTPTALKNSCLQIISNNFRKLSNDFTRLPFTLIDEFYQRKDEFGLNPPSFNIFLNATTKKLKLNDFHCSSKPINEISMKISEFCVNLTHLILTPQRIDLKSKDLEELMCGIPQLQYLNVLYRIGLSDSVLRVIGNNCLQLRHLELCACTNVTDVGIRFLCLNDDFSSRNSKISFLKLRATSMTSHGFIMALKYLQNLKNLVLEFSFVSDLMKLLKEEYDSNVWINNSLEYISHFEINNETKMEIVPTFFPNLREIIIANMKNGLEHVRKFSKLKILNIYQIDFNIIALEEIGKGLTSLTLDSISNVDINIITNFCPMLKHLELLHDTIINTSTEVRKLKDLKIHNSVFSEQHLFTMLINAVELKRLHLSEFEIVTDDYLTDIFRKNPLNCLEFFALSNCDNFTIRSLMVLLELNNPLKEIKISNCENINYNELLTLENYVRTNNLDVIFKGQFMFVA